MSLSPIASDPRKKMAILTSYFEGEAYGLLGPQMAATIIQENTPYDCIVIPVTHSDDKEALKKALYDYFGKERPLIGFSTLSGREDLFALAKELKDEGAMTVLAGPQSDVDFLGETGWEDFSHRFRGLSAFRTNEHRELMMLTVDIFLFLIDVFYLNRARRAGHPSIKRT